MGWGLERRLNPLVGSTGAWPLHAAGGLCGHKRWPVELRGCLSSRRTPKALLGVFPGTRCFTDQRGHFPCHCLLGMLNAGTEILLWIKHQIFTWTQQCSITLASRFRPRMLHLLFKYHFDIKNQSTPQGCLFLIRQKRRMVSGREGARGRSGWALPAFFHDHDLRCQYNLVVLFLTVGKCA